MTSRHAVLFALLVALLVSACGGEAGTANPVPVPYTAPEHATCVPGEQNNCQCDNGASGKQKCSADGQFYGTCACVVKKDSGKDSCEVDEDCSEFNTACYASFCINYLCFVPSAECGQDAGKDTGANGDAQADAGKPQTVTVTLAADTPAGATLVKNATGVPMVKVNLTANYDAKINHLRLHRVGTGAVTDIAKACLFDQNGNGVGACHPVDPATNMVEFESLNLTIPAGNTLSYTVRADFAGDAIGTTGGQHAFELQDASSVWLSDAGQVQGSFPVRGNTFSVSSASAATLEVRLASNPVSSTVVKKTQRADVLGIRFTASTNDVALTQLPIKCQASIHGADYSATDCWKRISSLALYDGATQIGVAQSPDMTGLAKFTLNWAVPNGMTKNLTVKATFASVASDSEPWDKVAFGVDGIGGAAQDNVYGQYVPINIETSLANQLAQDPTVVTTILPSGKISIVADHNALPSTNLIGGVSGTWNWDRFARYTATAQYEKGTIDRLAMFMPQPGASESSDDSDCTAVGVAINGNIMGTAILPAGKYGTVDVDLASNPIAVPKDGSVSFDLVCQLAAPVPAYAIPGDGVPRSGHRPALGINWSKQTGEWNANYANAMNVRATGDASGERLYAPIGATPGNMMVLRKNVPTLTKLALPSTVLQKGDNVAYVFQIATTPYGTGSISIGQFAFEITTTPGVKYTPILYKNDVPANTYGYAYDNNMAEPCYWGNGNYCWTGQHSFLFRFYQEDVVTAGSPATYKLVLQVVEAPIMGSAITIGAVQQGTHYTAKVNDFGCSAQPTTMGLGLDSNPYSRPGIIWSDQSEVPHGFLTNCLPSAWSSTDWIGDYLIKDMNTVSILSN